MQYWLKAVETLPVSEPVAVKLEAVLETVGVTVQIRLNCPFLLSMRVKVSTHPVD